MLSRLESLSITPKHREDWYRAMGKTAAEGYPQVDVLALMKREFAKTKHPIAPLVRELMARLQGSVRPGAPALRTVGSELTGLVPEGEAMLVLAGDQSGLKAEGFMNAADYVATQTKLKDAVWSAVGKPVFYLAALLGLLIFFSIKVFPAFEKARPRSGWPGSAQMLGTISDHIAAISIGTIGFLVFAGILITYLTPRWTGEGRDFADKHLFPFPLIASINGASLLTSLSGYLSAGTPLVDAYQNIAHGSAPYMKDQCNRALRLLKQGKRSEEALVTLPIIAPKYHWLIAVYGLSSDTAAAYKNIAREMVELVQAYITNLFDRVISNLLMAAVGGMLMWIYISMFGIVDPGTSLASTSPTVVVTVLVS